MSQQFNVNLTEAERERLAILAEEMGEAIQTIGKVLRHGYESRNPLNSESLTNRHELTIELGDVRYAIGLLCAAGDVEHGDILKRRDEKHNKIQRYLHHQ